MLAYVCTPYRAEEDEQFEKQLKHTKYVSREIVLAGHEVEVPHLLYTQFLRDDSKTERAIGMASALKHLRRCDAIFVSIRQKVSQGMEAEIAVAKKLRLPMYFFGNMNDLKDILKRLDAGQGNEK